MVNDMKKYIKKADIILAIVLVIICAASCAAVYGIGKAGSMVRVTVDGELYGTYPLNEDRSIEIDTDFGENTLTISDGKALMTSASCPDKYCMNQHKSSGGIDSTDQTIICLPNRVAVSIDSGGGASGSDDGEGKADAVVG